MLKTKVYLCSFASKDWLEIIYLTDDIHLTKTGNRMLSDKIIKESFKE